jgi:DNA-binding transcriptional MocR family regulator
MRFDMGQPVLVHRMLADFLGRGELDRHVARMRSLYAERARVMCDALAAHAAPWLAFAPPAGGFYVWLALRGGLASEALRRHATRAGVLFPSGASFFPERRDPGGEHVRLAFPWVPPSDLVESARRLGRACAELERCGGSPSR